MKWIKIFRANDWWEYKIPPILAIAYGSFYLEKILPINHWELLIALMAILIPGAVFVSILNDYTDIESDKRAGKKNRLEDKSRGARKTILFLSLLPCIGIFFFLYPDWKSVILYFGALVSYVLYSCPPFRLKNHKFSGLITDSMGSQMFPSLLVITIIFFITKSYENWLWFGLVAIWSFCYGIRGILWHQLSDKENDTKSGVKTFATETSPKAIMQFTVFIFIFECLAFTAMLILLQSTIVWAGLIIYLVSLWGRLKMFKFRIVLSNSTSYPKYHLFLYEFYQLFFPVSLLLAAVVLHTPNWIILTLHLLLFQKILKTFLRDMYRLAEPLINKKYIHHD